MTRRTLWQVEASLWALTLISVLMARRLFDSWDYAPLWLILAAGGHATAAVTRRQRWPLALSITASTVVLIIAQGIALYSGTLWLRLLPSAETLRQAASDIESAWHAFGIVEAPTPATAGFLLVGGAAVWLAAFCADAVSLRARLSTEALLPSFGVLAFVGALGTDDWRIRSAAAMVLCAVVFVAAHGIHHTADRVLLGASERRRSIVPMRTALRFGTAAAVIAALAVPLLPGSDAPAIVSWKDLDGTAPASRVTISPLVNAQGRLVGASDAELFRVEADAPAYWRMSGLSQFDGEFWGSEQLYANTAQALSGPVSPSVFTQTFTISALDSIWLPAAFEPVAYDGPDALYDAETGTLVTTHNTMLEPGLSYTVRSASDIPSLAGLVAADGDVPPEIAEKYLGLPDGFNPRVAGLAAEITADASGPYAKALVLQDFFLENFVYSLRVPSGHGTDRMEQFLFEDRRGYCEQFAGTYAAMARSIGLPARVAVGFTPGELVDGVYVVTGSHYHAWPEVWIGGRWVYFEPTPGRGAPGAVVYTGVPTQQVVPGDPEAAGEAGSGFIGQLGIEDLEGLSDDFGGFVDVLGADGSGEETGVWSEWLVVPFYAVVAVGVLWLIAIPAAVRLRRVLHHRRARHDARAAIAAAWDDVAETLFNLGIDRRPAETHVEFANRVRSRLRIETGDLQTLAVAAQEASYAADPPSTQTVAAARSSAEHLETRIRAARSRWDRIGAACRPTMLVSGPRSRRRGRESRNGVLVRDR